MLPFVRPSLTGLPKSYEKKERKQLNEQLCQSRYEIAFEGKLSKTLSRNVNRVVSMVFIFAKVTILSNLNQFIRGYHSMMD